MAILFIIEYLNPLVVSVERGRVLLFTLNVLKTQYVTQADFEVQQWKKDTDTVL